jgi:pimeloyl-ACP methyl ester carboxylesterase
MTRHADDIVALLDAQGIDRAVIVGHSMGGFVSVVLARRHPDRLSRLVLVDGGPPLPIPAGMSAATALHAVVGPAIDRLAMTFPDRQAYHAFWRAHPAFAGHWSALVEAYVGYDLVGEPAHLHSRTNAQAVEADAPDFFVTGPTLPEAMLNLQHPTTLLLAERGMLNEPTPLYRRQTIDEWLVRLPNLTARIVHDVNHYTILWDPKGITAVVAEIRAALAANGAA